MPLRTLAQFFSTLAVVAIELVAVAAVCVGLYAVLTLLLRAAPIPVVGREWRGSATLRARAFLFSSMLVAAVGVLAFNGYLVVRGVDVYAYTVNLLRSITADRWIALTTALGQLGLAILGFRVLVRLVRRQLVPYARRMLNRWDRLEENDKSLATLLGALERTVVHAGWLLLAVYASVLLQLPLASPAPYGWLCESTSSSPSA